MNPRIHRVVLVVLVIALVSVQTTSGAPRLNRELVFYDTIQRTDTLKLREWTWDKWSSCMAACAVVRWNTIEGDGGTSDYCICKDKEGVWCLAIHVQGSDRTASEKNYWRDEWTVAYSIERVRKLYLDELPGKPISRSRQLAPRQYSLELKDKSGKILYHL